MDKSIVASSKLLMENEKTSMGMVEMAGGECTDVEFKRIYPTTPRNETNYYFCTNLNQLLPNIDKIGGWLGIGWGYFNCSERESVSIKSLGKCAAPPNPNKKTYN